MKGRAPYPPPRSRNANSVLFDERQCARVHYPSGAGGFDLPVPLATGLTGSIHLQHIALQLPFTLQLSSRLRVTVP